MPNLTHFYLKCNSEKEMRQYYYDKLVKKVLELKNINSVYIFVGNHWSSKNYYSKNKIKRLCPNINFNNFYSINIHELGEKK